MKKYGFHYRFLDATTTNETEPLVAKVIVRLYHDLLLLYANNKSLAEAISQQSSIGPNSSTGIAERLKEMLLTVEKDGDVCKGIREAQLLSHADLGVR